jgi:hypothetical protein
MASALIAERNRACLDACSECEQACEACAYGCCMGSAEMVACGQLCLDCAAISRLCQTLLERGSAWATKVCELCAEICEACAAECAKHEDEACRRCAEACQRCVRECRAMVSAAV